MGPPPPVDATASPALWQHGETVELTDQVLEDETAQPHSPIHAALLASFVALAGLSWVGFIASHSDLWRVLSAGTSWLGSGPNPNWPDYPSVLTWFRASVVYGEIAGLGWLATAAFSARRVRLCDRLWQILLWGIAIVGVWSTVLLGLSVLQPGPLHGGLFVVAIVLGSLVAARRRHWRTHPAPEAAALRSTRVLLTRWDWMLIAVCSLGLGIIGLFRLYHSLLYAPMEWDELIYHAALGVIFANTGGVPPELASKSLIGIGMSGNYPPLYPTLQAAVFVTAGSTHWALAKPLGLLFSGGLLVATYALGRRLVSWRVGLIAAAILAVTPMLYHSIFLHPLPLQVFLAAVIFSQLLRATTDDNFAAYLVAAAAFGLAALTSFQGLFFGPLLAAAGIWMLVRAWRRNELPVAAGTVAAAVGLAMACGGFWYVRMWLVLGNPFFPHFSSVFGSANVDQPSLEYALSLLDAVSRATWIGFGQPTPTWAGWADLVLRSRSFFPAWSGLTLGAIFVAFAERDRHRIMLLAGVGFVVAAFSMSPSFPRYFTVLAPPLAVVVAIWMSRLWSADSSTTGELSKGVGTFLMAGILLVPGVAVAVAGPAFVYFPASDVAGNLDYYLDGHETEPEQLWARAFGGEAAAWAWLNERPNSRFVSLENRIYQFGPSGYNRLVSLDSLEAAPLREPNSIPTTRQALDALDVQYVLLAPWMHQTPFINHFPWVEFMGRAEFPIVFDNFAAQVYQVGPVDDPVTANSTQELTFSVAWQYDGDVRLLEAGNEAARLYTHSTGAAMLQIRYLDVGTDPIIFNARDGEHNWTMGIGRLERHNSGQWVDGSLLLPDPGLVSPGGIELGVFVEHTDLRISSAQFNLVNGAAHRDWKVSSNVACAPTIPESSFVYLPALNATTTLEITAVATGHDTRIELFEGLISPSTTTEWWLGRTALGRSEIAMDQETMVLTASVPAGWHTIVLPCYDSAGDGLGSVTVGVRVV